MSTKNQNLTSLITSRICHDLVNPLGAIQNGLELLELSGVPKTAEFTLVVESVLAANARISYFNYAFGRTASNLRVSSPLIRNLLNVIYEQKRVSVNWQILKNQPRVQIKLALLLILCFENSLPLGGNIVVQKSANIWLFRAFGPKGRFNQSIWNNLIAGNNIIDITPAQVQFALAQHMFVTYNIKPKWHCTQHSAEMDYTVSVN